MFLDRNKEGNSALATFEYSMLDKSFCVSQELFDVFEIKENEARKNFFSIFLKTLPADRKRLMRMLRLTMSEKCDNDFIYRIMTNDSMIKHIRLTLSLSGKKIIGSIQDITHYRVIDERIKVLSTALEQNPNMIGIADTRGKVKYINRAYSDVTGYSLKELYGKSFSIVSSGKHPKSFYRKLWSVLQKGDVWRGEFINKRKSGELFYSGAHIFPIKDDQGEIAYFVATEKDITLQKKQQEKSLVREKQAQMGEMISMIAHQWRQPLSSIGTIAATMKISLDLGEKDNKSLYEGIEKINDHVQFLSNTVNDFRNFFNPNKHKEMVMASDVTQEAAAIMKHTLENKGISFLLEFGDDTRVLIHKNEMMQVLLNLMKNAQDVLVEKNITDPKITIKAVKIGEKVIIDVMDNAGGIPEDIQHKIFDPYFSTKNEKVGTGLGLHMSKIIVEQHNNGILSAENSSEGAVFRITLPYYDTKGSIK